MLQGCIDPLVQNRFAYVDGSEPYRKGRINENECEVVSRLKDRYFIVNYDSKLWKVVKSNDDDEDQQNEKNKYEKNETLLNFEHDVPVMSNPRNVG